MSLLYEPERKAESWGIVVLMHYWPDQWLGNKWDSIQIEPRDENIFLRLLAHLSLTYAFPMPPIIDTIDGYAAACSPL